MKCLSLIQPWASLIAWNAKRYETRSWRTSYRGPLAIHASKTTPAAVKALCWQEPFRSVLEAHDRDWRNLPRGGIVAVCRLVEVYSTYYLTGNQFLSRQERAFGDFTTGRFAWELADVRPVEPFIVCGGARSLWDLPADVADQLGERLAIAEGM